MAQTLTCEVPAVLESTLKVTGATTLAATEGTSGVFSTTLKVKEAFTLEGELKGKAAEHTSGVFTTTLKVKETLTAEGAATVAKTLKVTELTSTEGGLTVTGAFKSEGAATVAKTLKVTELTTTTGGLTVEGTLTLPANSILEAAIKEEQVSKTKLAKAVQEELLKVAKPSAGAAYTSAKEETETKPTYITLILKCPATATVNKCELVNGGVNMFFEFDGSAVAIQKIPVTFLVEKGGKWKATMTGVTSTEIFRQVINSV